jgi:hypothetical protein
VQIKRFKSQLSNTLCDWHEMPQAVRCTGIEIAGQANSVDVIDLDIRLDNMDPNAS